MEMPALKALINARVKDIERKNKSIQDARKIERETPKVKRS